MTINVHISCLTGPFSATNDYRFCISNWCIIQTRWWYISAPILVDSKSYFSGKRIWQVHQYTIFVTFILNLFITFYQGQSQICDLKEITKNPKIRSPRKLPDIYTVFNCSYKLNIWSVKLDICFELTRNMCGRIRYLFGRIMHLFG